MGIVGEPGVGKSRLCYEVIQAHAAHGWLILETSADSYSQATPYRPIIDLLKAYFQLDARDDLQTIRDKVTDKLLALETTLQPILPALLVLLEVPVDDSQWQALDPSQRRQHIIDAVKYLLLRESQIQPLCLVVENLHWLDAETQGFLDGLVESLPAARVLLLVSYRPEYRHNWGSKTYYTQLRLDPLPPESAAALLQALLGDEVGMPGQALLQDLTQRLIVRIGGNPFFLEESIRSLVETHVLTGEPGAYRLAQPVSHLQVPATVQAVLAARIDRLPAEDKRLLQTAAVIGHEVPYTTLQAIVARPAAALRQGLAHLQQGEFLYERGLFTELAYTFKHALTHEVAYVSLQQERRRSLHACILNALETLYPDRLAEQVERLAHHALRAEVWDKAVAYCRQAGAKAMTHSAYREAVASFEQALEALSQLPARPDTQAQAIDLRLDLRSALWPLGELGRIFICLQDAEALAETLGDPHRLGWVSAARLAHFAVTGDPDHALASGQRALALAANLGDMTLTVFAQHYLGHVYRNLGDYRQAMDFYRKNMTHLQGELRRERLGLPGLAPVTSRTYLVVSLAECGAFAEGRSPAEEGVRIAEATDHPFSRVLAYWAVGYRSLCQGDAHQAIPVLERARDLTRVMHTGLQIPSVVSLSGAAYALAGLINQALPLLEQAVEQAVAMGFMLDHALHRVWLGEAYLLAGRLAEALTQAERALEFSRTHRERAHAAYALRLLGEIAAQRDPPGVESAGAHYRQALALAQERGMRPLQAHCHRCHRGLGTLYAKIDRPEQACTELSAAIDLYRAMDMTLWLPQAEAAQARLGR
ncbi:MAG: ATP-binding protein [Candidatus Entotheonellia bacterium]